ncbi:MAG: aminopeptidase [Clostridiales bacterium]|nr:aminopeptidase [Clostridiales bacterium]MCF8022488.1 aminopeptidase [Clostridiales bacterium]
MSNHLKYEKKNIWNNVDQTEHEKIMNFAENYKRFLNNAKTERETVNTTVSMLSDAGFKDLNKIENQLKAGDKVFAVIQNKSLVAMTIGEENLTEGFNLVGAHVDSPRIDLKPHPVAEIEQFSLLKTHYYGGIKKYHWLAVPLALHGVVMRSDGFLIQVVIGEDPSDPVFTIADLLPHLAKDQMDKKMSKVFTGEDLRPLLSSIPSNEQNEEKVKTYVLELLYEKYGIIEEDLVSAELELVPAWMARDVGLDRSMIGAYGQDDRICAYTGLKAIMDIENPLKTSVLLLADKEEIGSVGNTGMDSDLLENVMSELIYLYSGNDSNLALRRALANSSALSADVNAALNPNFSDVVEADNAARLGNGICITKYTGSGGKKGANDSHAEFLGFIRNIYNSNNVIWQSGELGKVDQGGGGTIAYMLAEYGMNVIDCGISLLGMHSPMEVSSKADIYMAYKGYYSFLNHKY